MLSHIAPSENSPGCRLVGTRRVKGNVCSNKSTEVVRVWSEDGGWKKRVISDHASADGTEEVEHWICDPECPIRLLDEQAGERKGDRPGRTPRLKRAEEFGWSGSAAQDVITKGFSDSGGPSRFYATFPGEEDSASRFLYCSKASKKDRGLVGVKRIKLRADLTPERRAWVLAELQKAGVAL